MKSEEQDWLDAAFLAAGIDPEYSAVIHAYRTDVYVHALADTLVKYMKRVQELEKQLYPIGWNLMCTDTNCKKCIQDDPRTWGHSGRNNQ